MKPRKHAHAPQRTRRTARTSVAPSLALASAESNLIVEQILQGFRNSGCRITKLRSFLVSLLVQSRRPLSISDIRAALENAHMRADKTSLYREIYFLMEQKVVSEVDFLDGMKRYEYTAERGHHHHMFCKRCASVECVDVCFDVAHVLKEIAQKSSFKVQSHVLEFFGLCEKCAK